jgi:hypothetical protein
MEALMENDKTGLPSSDNTGKKAKRILSVSLAAAGLLASATSALGSIVSTPIEKAKTAVELSVQQTGTNIPAPLVLKPANSNQQLAFDHESHASHSSHASHASHASHSSGL